MPPSSVLTEQSCLTRSYGALGLPATRFKVVGYWTPVAAWDEKFAALPDSVQKELDAIWADADGDEPEDVQVRFEERLDQLGL